MSAGEKTPKTSMDVSTMSSCIAKMPIMADTSTNCNNFQFTWNFVIWRDCTIFINFKIFWLQYSTSNFGNPPLWTSLWRFVKGSILSPYWLANISKRGNTNAQPNRFNIFPNSQQIFRRFSEKFFENLDEGTVKLVQLVKIAILFLHFMSKPFDLIILSSSK